MIPKEDDPRTDTKTAKERQQDSRKNGKDPEQPIFLNARVKLIERQGHSVGAFVVKQVGRVFGDAGRFQFVGGWYFRNCG